MIYPENSQKPGNEKSVNGVAGGSRKNTLWDNKPIS